MKNKIVIIGGGGFAKAIISVINSTNEYEIIGYTDTVNKGTVFGIKYLGNDQSLKDVYNHFENCSAVIAIESNSVSSKRQKLYSMLKNLGFNLPVIISKSAIINEQVRIGEGTVVLEGAIINVSSIIGKGVIINTGAVIEHDCIVGDFVHFASGSIIGGGVEVGDNSIIGMNAKVIQYKKVGNNCLIHIGSIVIKDTLQEGSYFGIPARRVEL